MSTELNQKIIAKYLEDREVIKNLKKRHAEELRTLEEFQSKREAALMERGDISCFSFFTDLYINGRDGKAEKEKEKESIALNQSKIESWLLKMLSSVGEGIKTEFGTVFKTRKESVTCGDFELFVNSSMLKPAAYALTDAIQKAFYGDGTQVRECPLSVEQIREVMFENLHLEFLNKAIAKAPVLELMGEQDPKDHSRPNPPPAGVNYVAIQTVGVRKK